MSADDGEYYYADDTSDGSSDDSSDDTSYDTSADQGQQDQPEDQGQVDTGTTDGGDTTDWGSYYGDTSTAPADWYQPEQAQQQRQPSYGDAEWYQQQRQQSPSAWAGYYGDSSTGVQPSQTQDGSWYDAYVRQWAPQQPLTTSPNGQPATQAPTAQVGQTAQAAPPDLQIDRSSSTAFINSFVPSAVAALEAKGYPASLAPILAAIPMNEQGYQTPPPNNSNNYYGIKGCFDATTEVLTRGGWKAWPSVTGADRLASPNPYTGRVDYEHPTHLIRYRHTGLMYRIDARDVDLLVTPEHRLWVRPSGQRLFRLLSARDMAGCAVEPLPVASVAGKRRIARIELQPVATLGPHVRHVVGGRSALQVLRPYARRIVTAVKHHLFRSQGHAVGDLVRHAVGPSDPSNRAHSRPDEAIGLPIPGRDPKPTWTKVGRVRRDGAVLVDLRPEPLFERSEHVAPAHPTAALAVPVSDRLLPDQEIASADLADARDGRLLGHRLSPSGGVAPRPSDTRCGAFVRNNDTRFEGWVAFDGEVYCATVPNGLLIVRRNGKAVVSGNSNPITGANTGPVGTWEEINGQRVNIQDTFRAYDTPADSVADFLTFLESNPRYANAVAIGKETGDPAQFVRAIHQAGYATDSQWSNKILNLAGQVSPDVLAAAEQPSAGARAAANAQIPPGHYPGDGHDHGVATPYAQQQVAKDGTVYTVAFDYLQPYDQPFNPAVPLHRGIDLQPTGAPNGGENLPYTAFRSGRVYQITHDPNGGIGIIVATGDPNAPFDRYFHNNAISVHQGDYVQAGVTPLGVIGETGTEGFPHLHYEVSHNPNGDPMGQTIDPRPYIGPQPATSGAPVTYPTGAAPTAAAVPYQPPMVNLDTPYTSGNRTQTTGIVIHSTQGQGATPQQEFQNTLDYFHQNPYQVSANAVIAADGTIAMPSNWDAIAHHAGENNATMFGIELAQSAADAARQVPYTDAQYQSLGWLMGQLNQRYGVPLDRQHVVGHEELDQGIRQGKTDPGPNFDWSRALTLGTQAVQARTQPQAQAPQPQQQARPYYPTGQRPVTTGQGEVGAPTGGGASYTVAGRPATQEQYNAAVAQQQQARTQFEASLPDNTRQAYDEWAAMRTAQGQSIGDIPEFRAHLGRLGAPDPWAEQEQRQQQAQQARAQFEASLPPTTRQQFQEWVTGRQANGQDINLPEFRAHLARLGALDPWTQQEQQATARAQAQAQAQAPAVQGQGRMVYTAQDPGGEPYEITEAQYNTRQAQQDAANRLVTAHNARVDAANAELQRLNAWQARRAAAEVDPEAAANLGSLGPRPETPNLDYLQAEGLALGEGALPREASAASQQSLRAFFDATGTTQGPQYGPTPLEVSQATQNAVLDAQKQQARDEALLQAAQAPSGPLMAAGTWVQSLPGVAEGEAKVGEAAGQMAGKVVEAAGHMGDLWNQYVGPYLGPRGETGDLDQAEYQRNLAHGYPEDLARARATVGAVDPVHVPPALQQPREVTIPGTPAYFDQDMHDRLVQHGASEEEAQRLATTPATPARTVQIQYDAPEASYDPGQGIVMSTLRAWDRMKVQLGSDLLGNAMAAANAVGATPLSDVLAQRRQDMEAEAAAQGIYTRGSQGVFDPRTGISPTGLWESLVENAPSTIGNVATLALAAMGGPIGEAVLGPSIAEKAVTAARVVGMGTLIGGSLQQASQTRRDLDQDVYSGRISPATANMAGITAGVVEAWTEHLFPDAEPELRAGLTHSVVEATQHGIIRRGFHTAEEMLGHMTTEAAEEAISQISQEAMTQALAENKPSLMEAANNIATAALVGGVSGGILTAPHLAHTALATHVVDAMEGRREAANSAALDAMFGSPAATLAQEGVQVRAASPDLDYYVVRRADPNNPSIQRAFVLHVAPNFVGEDGKLYAGAITPMGLYNAAELPQLDPNTSRNSQGQLMDGALAVENARKVLQYLNRTGVTTDEGTNRALTQLQQRVEAAQAQTPPPQEARESRPSPLIATREAAPNLVVPERWDEHGVMPGTDMAVRASSHLPAALVQQVMQNHAARVIAASISQMTDSLDRVAPGVGLTPQTTARRNQSVALWGLGADAMNDGLFLDPQTGQPVERPAGSTAVGILGGFNHDPTSVVMSAFADLFHSDLAKALSADPTLAEAGREADRRAIYQRSLARFLDPQIGSRWLAAKSAEVAAHEPSHDIDALHGERFQRALETYRTALMAQQGRLVPIMEGLIANGSVEQLLGLSAQIGALNPHFQGASHDLTTALVARTADRGTGGAVSGTVDVRGPAREGVVAAERAPGEAVPGYGGAVGPAEAGRAVGSAAAESAGPPAAIPELGPPGEQVQRAPATDQAQPPAGPPTTQTGPSAMVAAEVARTLPGPVAIPEDPAFRAAVANTPGARITPEGLEANYERHQAWDQAGAPAVRSAVFGLPSPQNRNPYRLRGSPAGYGGPMAVSGQTLFQRPLVVRGATGGRVPAVAYDQLVGRRGAYEDLRQQVFRELPYFPTRRDPRELAFHVAAILERHGGDPSVAQELAYNHRDGNRLYTGILENIAAAEARRQGYDSIVGHNRGRLSELIDLRAATYPDENGHVELHPQFQPGGEPYQQLPLFGPSGMAAGVPGVPAQLDPGQARPNGAQLRDVALTRPIPTLTQYDPQVQARLEDAGLQVDLQRGLVIPSAAPIVGAVETDLRPNGGISFQELEPGAGGQEVALAHPVIFEGGTMAPDRAHALAQVLGQGPDMGSQLVEAIQTALTLDGPTTDNVKSVMSAFGLGDPGQAALLVKAARGDTGQGRTSLATQIVSQMLAHEGRIRGHDGLVTLGPNGETSTAAFQRPQSQTGYGVQNGQVVYQGPPEASPGYQVQNGQLTYQGQPGYAIQDGRPVYQGPSAMAAAVPFLERALGDNAKALAEAQALDVPLSSALEQSAAAHGGFSELEEDDLRPHAQMSKDWGAISAEPGFDPIPHPTRPQDIRRIVTDGVNAGWATWYRSFPEMMAAKFGQRNRTEMVDLFANYSSQLDPQTAWYLAQATAMAARENNGFRDINLALREPVIDEATGEQAKDEKGKDLYRFPDRERAYAMIKGVLEREGVGGGGPFALYDSAVQYYQTGMIERGRPKTSHFNGNLLAGLLGWLADYGVTGDVHMQRGLGYRAWKDGLPQVRNTRGELTNLDLQKEAAGDDRVWRYVQTLVGHVADELGLHRRDAQAAFWVAQQRATIPVGGNTLGQFRTLNPDHPIFAEERAVAASAKAEAQAFNKQLRDELKAEVDATRRAVMAEGDAEVTRRTDTMTAQMAQARAAAIEQALAAGAKKGDANKAGTAASNEVKARLKPEIDALKAQTREDAAAAAEETRQRLTPAMEKQLVDVGKATTAAKRELDVETGRPIENPQMRINRWRQISDRIRTGETNIGLSYNDLVDIGIFELQDPASLPNIVANDDIVKLQTAWDRNGYSEVGWPGVRGEGGYNPKTGVMEGRRAGGPIGGGTFPSNENRPMMRGGIRYLTDTGVDTVFKRGQPTRVLREQQLARQLQVQAPLISMVGEDPNVRYFRDLYDVPNVVSVAGQTDEGEDRVGIALPSMRIAQGRLAAISQAAADQRGQPVTTWRKPAWGEGYNAIQALIDRRTMPAVHQQVNIIRQALAPFGAEVHYDGRYMRIMMPLESEDQEGEAIANVNSVVQSSGIDHTQIDWEHRDAHTYQPEPGVLGAAERAPAPEGAGGGGPLVGRLGGPDDRGAAAVARPSDAEIGARIADRLVGGPAGLAPGRGPSAMAAEAPSGLWEPLPQQYDSAATSLNQTPALFGRVPWVSGNVNLDLGGGRYDTASDWLRDNEGVTNLVYDPNPQNRTPEHNQQVLQRLAARGGADTVTVANVLNVIKEPEVRAQVIRQAADALAPGGTAYFSVYEKRGDGVGESTGAGRWQNNLPIEDYLGEIQAVFPDAALGPGGVISGTRPNEITEPSPAGPSAMVSATVAAALPIEPRTMPYPRIFQRAMDLAEPDANGQKPYLDPNNGIIVFPGTARNMRPEIMGLEAARGIVYYRLQPGYHPGFYGTERAQARGLGGEAQIAGEMAFRNPLVYQGGVSVADHARQLALIMSGQPYDGSMAPRGEVTTRASQIVRTVQEQLTRGGYTAENVARIIRDMGMGDPSVAPLLIQGVQHVQSKTPITSLSDMIITHMLGVEGRAHGYDGVITYTLAPRGVPQITEGASFAEQTNPDEAGRSTLYPQYGGGPSAMASMYHGTAGDFYTPDTDRFDPGGLYGPGYYLTTDPRVAASYADARTNQLMPDVEGMRRMLANNPNMRPQLRAQYERAIADAEAGIGLPAPNIRKVDVPDQLNLLEAERPIGAEQLAAIKAAAERARVPVLFSLNELGPNDSGHDVYGALWHDVWSSGGLDNQELARARTNAILAQAGLDGVRYSGGRRIPMADEQGNPIEHEAVAVFPHALDRLTNQFSGTPEYGPSAMAAEPPAWVTTGGPADDARAEAIEGSPRLLAAAAESTARLHEGLVEALAGQPAETLDPAERRALDGHAAYYTNAIVGLASEDPNRLERVGLDYQSAQAERERAIQHLQRTGQLDALYNAEAAWASLAPRDDSAEGPSAMAGMVPSQVVEPFYSRLLQVAGGLPEMIEGTPERTIPEQQTEGRIVRRPRPGETLGEPPPGRDGRPSPLVVDADGNWVQPGRVTPAQVVPGTSAADEVMRQVRAGGARPDEIAWTGLERWLRDQGDGPIARQDLLGYLNQRRINVQDVVLGGRDLGSIWVFEDGVEPIEQEPYQVAEGHYDENGDWVEPEWAEPNPEDQMWRYTYQAVPEAAPQDANRYYYAEGNPDEGYWVTDADGVAIAHSPLPTTAHVEQEILQHATQAMKPSLPEGAAGPVQYEWEPGDPNAPLVLPGGRDYRELVMTLPVSKDDMLGSLRQASDEATSAYMRFSHDEHRYDQILADPALLAQSNALREPMIRLQTALAAAQERYNRSRYLDSHWTDPATGWALENALLHVRFTTRIGPNGERILFIEELQSDWQQQGREKGFLPPEGGLPSRYRIEYRPVTGVDVTKPLGRGGRWDANQGRYVNQEMFEPGTPEHADLVRNASRWHTITPGPQGDVERVFLKEEDARDHLKQQIHAQRPPPEMPFQRTEAWTALGMRRMIRWAAEHGYDQVAWTTGQQQNERYGPSRIRNPQALPKFYDGVMVTVATDLGKAWGVAPRMGRIAANELDSYGRVYQEPGTNGWRAESPYRDWTIGGYPSQEAAQAGLDRENERAGHVQQVHVMDIPAQMKRSALEEGQPLYMAASVPKVLGGALYSELYGHVQNLDDVVPRVPGRMIPGRSEPERVIRPAAQNPQNEEPPPNRGWIKRDDGAWIQPAREVAPREQGGLTSAQNALAQLQAAGAKPDEMHWTGLRKLLEAHGDQPVTRARLLDHLNANRVRLTETMYGGPGSVPEDVDPNDVVLSREDSQETWPPGASGPMVSHIYSAGLPGVRLAQDPTYEVRVDPYQNEWELLDGETGDYLDRGSMEHPDDLAAAEAAIRDQAAAALPELGRQPENVQGIRWTGPGFNLPGGTEPRELILQWPGLTVGTDGWTAERLTPRTEGGTPFYRVRDDTGAVVGDYPSASGPGRAIQSAGLARSEPSQYENMTHWPGVQNPLVHVRFNIRTDAEGRRVLFIEELQSDWHQEGAAEGYREQGRPMTDEEQARLEEVKAQIAALEARQREIYNNYNWSQFGQTRSAEERYADAFGEVSRQLEALRDEQFKLEAIPSGGVGLDRAPWTRTSDWVKLAMRRMIRYAAENGIDRIAWTPGAVQDVRNKKTARVSELAYDPRKGRLHALMENGDTRDIPNMTPDKLSAYLSHGVGPLLLQQPLDANGHHVMTSVPEGTELRPTAFERHYDQLMPQVASELGQPYGVAPVRTQVGLGDQSYLVVDRNGQMLGEYPWSRRNEMFDFITDHPGATPHPLGETMQDAHAMDIPEAMQRSAMERGQPMFMAAGVPLTPEWDQQNPSDGLDQPLIMAGDQQSAGDEIDYPNDPPRTDGPEQLPLVLPPPPEEPGVPRTTAPAGYARATALGSIGEWGAQPERGLDLSEIYTPDELWQMAGNQPFLGVVDGQDGQAPPEAAAAGGGATIGPPGPPAPPNIPGVPNLGPPEENEPNFEQFPEWAQASLMWGQMVAPQAPVSDRAEYEAALASVLNGPRGADLTREQAAAIARQVVLAQRASARAAALIQGTPGEWQDIVKTILQGPNGSTLSQPEVLALAGAIMRQYKAFQTAATRATGARPTAWAVAKMLDESRRYSALRGLATLDRSQWPALEQVWRSAPVSQGESGTLEQFIAARNAAQQAGDQDAIARLEQEGIARAAAMIGENQQRMVPGRAGGADAEGRLVTYGRTMAENVTKYGRSPSDAAYLSTTPDLSLHPWETLSAIRYNNMLLGPRGILVDYVTNTGMLFGKMMADPFLLPMEGIVNPIAIAEITRAEYLALGRFLPLATRRMFSTLIHGVEESYANASGTPYSQSGRLARRIQINQEQGASWYDPKQIALRVGWAGTIAFGEIAGRMKAMADVFIRELAFGAEQTRQAAILAYRQGDTELGSEEWHQRVADIMAGKNLHADPNMNRVLYDEMTRNSTREAERTTFQGDMGTVGRFMQKIQRHPIGGIFLPFLKALYHIRGWAIDLSPVGAAVTLGDVLRAQPYRWAMAADNVGLATSMQRRTLGLIGGPYAEAYRGSQVGKGVADLDRRSIANVVGTAAFFYLLGLAIDGLTSASGPPDEPIVWLDDERPKPEDLSLRSTMEASGWRRNSILLRMPWNGKSYWLSYQNWGPLGYMIGATAALGEAYRYGLAADKKHPSGALADVPILGRMIAGGEALRDIVQGGDTETFKSARGRFFKSAADMSYVSGLIDLAGALQATTQLAFAPAGGETPSEAEKRQRGAWSQLGGWAVWSILSSWMPTSTLLNTIAQSQDPNARATEYGDISQGLANRAPDFLAPISPFADIGNPAGTRTSAPVRLDVLGRPVPNEYEGAYAWLPWRATESEMTNSTLNTLIQAGVGAPTPPTELYYGLRDKGAQGALMIRLPPQTRERVAELLGQAADARVQQELSQVSEAERQRDPQAWSDRLKAAMKDVYMTTTRAAEQDPEVKAQLDALASDSDRTRWFESKKQRDAIMGVTTDGTGGGAAVPATPAAPRTGGPAAPAAPAPAAPSIEDTRNRARQQAGLPPLPTSGPGPAVPAAPPVATPGPTPPSVIRTPAPGATPRPTAPATPQPRAPSEVDDLRRRAREQAGIP